MYSLNVLILMYSLLRFFNKRKNDFYEEKLILKLKKFLNKFDLPLYGIKSLQIWVRTQVFTIWYTTPWFLPIVP